MSFVGTPERDLDPVAAAAELAERQPRSELSPPAELPADTMLWELLPSPSGGAWSGCVHDFDRIRDDVPDPLNLEIHLRIVRAGRVAFEGSTSTGQLNRRLSEPCGYLGRCASYPVGVILLTGTGVVPPDAFTLAPNDTVVIRIEGIGEPTNTVTTVPA